MDDADRLLIKHVMDLVIIKERFRELASQGAQGVLPPLTAL